MSELRRAGFAALGTLALGAAGQVDAQPVSRAVEDVRLTRQAGVAAIEVVLACAVDYRGHGPTEGVEVDVRVELGDECVELLGTGIRSELHEPPRSTVSALRQLKFDARGGRQAVIVVSVNPPQRFTVSQGRARNAIRIELAPVAAVTLESGPPRAPVPEAAPAERPAGGERPPSPAPELRPREPLRLVQRPERAERFALQLASGEQVAAHAAALAPAVARERRLYINELGGDAGRWQELRLGFFATEQEARTYARGLPPPYAASIVVVADGDEQERASAASASSPGNGALANAPPPLGAERSAAMRAEADDALRAGDHDTAIRLYARLLEDSEFAARAEARERLGLARERKGQLAQARLEYGTYLAEFPDGSDADRVRQRLAGLNVGAEPARAGSSDGGSVARWDVRGGVAQYLRHLDIERRGIDAEPLQRSQLFSNVNLAIRRDGERFDLVSRIDAAYRYDLRDDADADGLLHVANAYVDVTDAERGWQARAGRQSRFGAGIVGRFDGAHVRYQWRPAVALNLALGSPVDHGRRAVDRQRQFVGFSAELDELVKEWDFSFFGILQQVDGIADREAVGAEARYRAERWHVVGALDADLSYSVVNSALVNATWRVTDKLTLNGRANAGAAPFIATRNAVIGQTAVTVERMLQTYSEAQLRRIARDRTAQAEQVTIGMARPLFDRFELTADTGYSSYDGTVASAGIVALPDLRQSFLQLQFVGSSVFKDGDTAVFGLRHTDSSRWSDDTLTFDVRLPTLRRLRLNPRLAVSQRRYAAGTEQWIAAPMLRLQMRWPRRHQLEVEIGVRESNRELAGLTELGTAMPLTDEETVETFVTAGYWWELGR
jgi:hypothetical protein